MRPMQSTPQTRLTIGKACSVLTPDLVETAEIASVAMLPRNVHGGGRTYSRDGESVLSATEPLSNRPAGRNFLAGRKPKGLADVTFN
jgi:hypothetical protein